MISIQDHRSSVLPPKIRGYGVGHVSSTGWIRLFTVKSKRLVDVDVDKPLRYQRAFLSTNARIHKVPSQMRSQKKVKEKKKNQLFTFISRSCSSSWAGFPPRRPIQHPHHHHPHHPSPRRYHHCSRVPSHTLRRHQSRRRH